MSREKIKNKLADKVHKVWTNWMLYIFSISVQNPDGSMTIPAEYIRRWRRQTNTEYKNLPKGEQASDIKIANEYIDIVIKNQIKEKIAPDPRAKKLINTYISYCQNIKGFKPDISWAVDTKMAKKRLSEYTENDLEELFDWYLNHELSSRLSASLKTCLSTGVINKWLQERGPQTIMY